LEFRVRDAFRSARRALDGTVLTPPLTREPTIVCARVRVRARMRAVVACSKYFVPPELSLSRRLRAPD
jgi:hypothetical protein